MINFIVLIGMGLMTLLTVASVGRRDRRAARAELRSQQAAQRQNEIDEQHRLVNEQLRSTLVTWGVGGVLRRFTETQPFRGRITELQGALSRDERRAANATTLEEGRAAPFYASWLPSNPVLILGAAAGWAIAAWINWQLEAGLLQFAGFGQFGRIAALTYVIVIELAAVVMWKAIGERPWVAGERPVAERRIAVARVLGPLMAIVAFAMFTLMPLAETRAEIQMGDAIRRQESVVGAAPPETQTAAKAQLDALQHQQALTAKTFRQNSMWGLAGLVAAAWAPTRCVDWALLAAARRRKHRAQQRVAAAQDELNAADESLYATVAQALIDLGENPATVAEAIAGAANGQHVAQHRADTANTDDPRPTGPPNGSFHTDGIHTDVHNPEPTEPTGTRIRPPFATPMPPNDGDDGGEPDPNPTNPFDLYSRR